MIEDEALDENVHQGYDPLGSLQDRTQEVDEKEAMAIEQISGYIHKVERLCDSINLDENHKRVLKESLDNINSHIVNLRKACDSQRSVSRSKDNSNLYINLKNPSIMHKKYLAGYKTKGMASISPAIPLIQRSMY